MLLIVGLSTQHVLIASIGSHTNRLQFLYNLVLPDDEATSHCFVVITFMFLIADLPWQNFTLLFFELVDLDVAHYLLAVSCVSYIYLPNHFR